MDPKIRYALRYLGHRPGASLSYFTGASVDLVPGQIFEVPAAGRAFGRRAEADLRVASSMVAPNSARVVPGENGLLLTDPTSPNCTEVNGVPTRSIVLQVGDQFDLAGMFRFEVVRSSTARGAHD